MYICPVCGFNQLEYPASNYNICPSCGTEFDLDDVGVTHSELRNIWLNNGAKWWSAEEPQSPYWDAEMQLENLNHFENAPKQTTANTVQKIDESKEYGFVAYWKQSWADVECYS